jgi:hypothetical protein
VEYSLFLPSSIDFNYNTLSIVQLLIINKYMANFMILAGILGVTSLEFLSFRVLGSLPLVLGHRPAFLLILVLGHVERRKQKQKKFNPPSLSS